MLLRSLPEEKDGGYPWPKTAMAEGGAAAAALDARGAKPPAAQQHVRLAAAAAAVSSLPEARGASYGISLSEAERASSSDAGHVWHEEALS